MDITCVIPCYNSGSTISRSVRSVVNQTVSVDEIIIIDDGSELETKKILIQIERVNANVNLLAQENKGVSIARNKGIALSNSEFILMLDADDTFESTYVEKALEAILVDERIGMVMCGFNMVSDNQIISTRFPEQASYNDYLFNNHGIANGLYRKEALMDIGGYDELMLDGYEDWDLHIRLKKNGWKHSIIREVLFNYSYTPNSRNKKALKKDATIKRYLFLKYKQEYIAHYPKLIDHFQSEIERREQTVLKREESMEYRIGTFLLKPLRAIKRILSL